MGEQGQYEHQIGKSSVPRTGARKEYIWDQAMPKKGCLCRGQSTVFLKAA